MDASLTEKMRPAAAMPLGCRRPPDRALRRGYRDLRHGGHRHSLHDGPDRRQRAGLEQLLCGGRPGGCRHGALEQLRCAGPAGRQRACPEHLRCGGPEGRRCGDSEERPRAGPGRRPNGGPGWSPRVHLGGCLGTRSGRGRRRHLWSLSRAASADSRRSPLGPSASRIPQPRSPTSSFNTTQTSEEGRSTISGATLFKTCPAASYSPTRSPAQYHRR
jgi:hypothetical protein